MTSSEPEPQLKVCVLAACPFPANHGTPGSIRELSEAIAARGHEVRVVTYHMGQDIPMQGIQLHRIKSLTKESGVVVGPTVRRPLYDLQMVFETIKVIRTHGIDIMHAHGYEAALAGWIAKMFTGVPLVYSGHNTMADELASYDFIRPKWFADKLAKFLDAWVPRAGNRCVPHSHNIKSFLHGMGLGERCEPVVNFGIDIDAVAGGDGDRVRKEYNLGDGPVILYAGVMDAFQRVDLLLEALVEVAYVEPDVKLLLAVTIDQPKHVEKIRAMAEQLGIAERVVITDLQTLDTIPDFLQACDVAVVPRPAAPGFPIKLLNYMAATKPCVMFASSSSGLTHRENVYLVDRDSSEALAGGLIDVLKDESLQGHLAREGHRFVRANHDRRGTAKLLCDTYLRALEGNKRFEEVAARPRVVVDHSHHAPHIDSRPKVREATQETSVGAST